MEEKTKSIYIDSQNVHQAIKKLGWILDRGKFYAYLYNKYKIQKAYMFLGYIPKYEVFYESLRKTGYEIIFKETYVKDGYVIKGNVDVDVAIQSVSDFFEQKLEIGFLVTADGDYNSLIKFFKTKNVFGKLLIPGTHDTSKFLTKEAGNSVQDISTLQHILSQ